jgi:hypothetical protein
MSKSVKLNGERIVYDYWERQSIVNTMQPEIWWYKCKVGGGAEEVGHVYIDYASPEAIRFWGGSARSSAVRSGRSLPIPTSAPSKAKSRWPFGLTI